MVLDGTMDDAAFLAYVEQVLVPTLSLLSVVGAWPLSDEVR